MSLFSDRLPDRRRRRIRVSIFGFRRRMLLFFVAYTVMFGDSDYLPGSNVPSTQTFTATSSNGKLTVSFKYTVAHKFWVRITQGEEDDSNSALRIEDSTDTDGAEYVGDVQEYPGIGDLTFTKANVTLPLTVYSVNA